MDYKGLEGEALFQAFQQGSISNGAPDNRLTKENILSFVSKATSVIKGQLTEIDLHDFNKIVFVEKSIGAVIGGIYAKQIGIEPYHLMLTPIDYAFRFTEKSQGSVFVGTNDSLCNYEEIFPCNQFAKICVNGDKQSELFGFLKARKGFKGFDMTEPDSNYLVRRLEKETPDFESTSDIKWNFTKFLVNRKCQVIERFEPTTDMEEVENAVKQLL